MTLFFMNCSKTGEEEKKLLEEHSDCSHGFSTRKSIRHLYWLLLWRVHNLHLRCPHLHPENKLRFRLVVQVHRSTSTPNSSEAGVLAAGDKKNVSIKLHLQKNRLEKERCL